MIKALMYSICPLTKLQPITGKFMSKEEFLKCQASLTIVDNYEWSSAIVDWVKSKVWLVGGVKAHAIWFEDGTCLELVRGRAMTYPGTPDAEYVNRIYAQITQVSDN